MFKFFKDKLKSTLGKFSEEIDKEGEEEKVKEKTEEEKEANKEEPVKTEKKKESKGESKEKESEETGKEKSVEEGKTEEEKEDEENKPEENSDADESEEKGSEEDSEKEEKGKRRGFFQWITTKKIDEDKFEELFWELETAMLENNVSIQVIEKIKEDLKKDIVNKPMKRKEIGDNIRNSLTESLKEVLSCGKINISEKIKEKKPYVICFLGVNGSGKTTTIAKIANKLKKEGNKVVMAAADTFRAAAIDQLDEHGKKLDVPVIKQSYGADPSAVVYDAINHAKKEEKDVVLADTAGRLHSNVNLVDELKKLIRVNDPDMKIFVGESLTGNDCVDQAERFNSSVGIDGTILTKADVDEKGGAAISVSYVTGKPIIYLGTGQEYDDIKEFNPEEILENLGL